MRAFSHLRWTVRSEVCCIRAISAKEKPQKNFRSTIAASEASTVASSFSESLDELATVDASLAAIVDLKFFCGFSFAEIARMQQTSERTVQRKWEKARI